MVGLDLFWEKIDGFILGKVGKHVVEHPADVVLAIIHDPLCFDVPEDWHSDALVIFGIGSSVRCTQELKAIDRIGGFKRRARLDLARSIAKRPA